MLLILLLNASHHMLPAKTTQINEKVMTLFRNTYTDVNNTIWDKKGDLFYVYFEKDGINQRMHYTADGEIVYSDRYYSNEQILPPVILGTIRKAFPDYRIKGVTEITEAGSITYYPTLEKGRSIVKLKQTSYGSYEVIDKFTVQQQE
jgi:hypothetical protein